MTRKRFGEFLARLVTLTPHDVSEILEEQAATRRRFGEIALALGLCKPDHIWRAWWAQLSGAPERVDIDVIGVDTQAISHLSREMAIRYSVVPLRASGTQMVIAAAEGQLMRAMEELPRTMKLQLKFVLADPQQIRRAIESYYPESVKDQPLPQTAVA